MKMSEDAKAIERLSSQLRGHALTLDRAASELDGELAELAKKRVLADAKLIVEKLEPKEQE